jgi:hypothetical protein
MSMHRILNMYLQSQAIQEAVLIQILIIVYILLGKLAGAKNAAILLTINALSTNYQ